MTQRRELFSIGFVALTVLGGTVALGLGQTPPPRRLPPSITGVTTAPAPTPTVSPVVGNQLQSTPQAPISRFLNDLRAFPPETEQAVYSMRSGADWLWRMNQTNGRFLPGLNPSIRQWLESDHDLRQAFGTLALAEAAKFTGDDRFAARANGSILSLLALTKLEAADATCRVPVTTSDRCNRVGFAAVLALAIDSLPNPDTKQLSDAEALCNFIAKQCRADGSIGIADDGQKADVDGAMVCPGLALQALSMSQRLKPDAVKRDRIAKAVTYYRGVVKTQPQPMLIATLLPSFVDYCLQNNKDAATATAVFEMADWLATCQYPRMDSRTPQWIGGFKNNPTAMNEPGFESALCVNAMCHAAKLTRQVPDLARFHKYRIVAVEGLNFLRTLQFTDESANHFEKTFRTNFLNGGTRLAPSDGTIRIDATSQLVLAHLAFLQSGGENRVE